MTRPAQFLQFIGAALVVCFVIGLSFEAGKLTGAGLYWLGAVM